MTSDLVCLDLPVRHRDDMNDPNVYVALDEGCIIPLVIVSIGER